MNKPSPSKSPIGIIRSNAGKQVTIQGETFPLKEPFFVMATQNPIESEGTYKLPEAQNAINFQDKENEMKLI